MMPIPESAAPNGFLRLPEAESSIFLKQCFCGIERNRLGIFHFEVKGTKISDADSKPVAL